MLLTVLGGAGLLAAMAVVVPLLAYGLSALFDWNNWGNRDDDGRGGVPAPQRPGPSTPPSPMTRSAEPGESDGTDR
ncbi:hypothetical protein [Aeromicrobium sp.]|uniref:hypothetical protein n=1 Tax=Aeromicrobium sp. TaxID=1871063 RepID=UPI002FC7FF6F